MLYTLFAAALPLTAAWPMVMEQVTQKRAAPVYPTVPKPLVVPNRNNCGSAGPCDTFNAEDQFVDVRDGSGHEWQAPGKNDQRGECPGLNAAANHGFAPRNGIWTIEQTRYGLNTAFSMSDDLAIVLAVVAINLLGDPVAGTWSIGGNYGSGALGGLLGQPEGILESHNRYEGDASIARGDAYLHDGKVGVFEYFKWDHMMSLLGPEDNFGQNEAAAQMYYTMEYSVQNNPYAFWAPFSGLVAPDAHNFCPNFMSNHSAENPGGQLSKSTLMSFFAMTENSDGTYTHHYGMERIPYNWYKRPSSNPANTASVNVDTVVSDLMYPGIVRIGGNTGTVNSFTGVDTGNLTGGVFNAKTLFEGNNLACFFLQASQAGTASAATSALALVDKYVTPVLTDLGCPQLKVDGTSLENFPGAKYKAEGQ